TLPDSSRDSASTRRPSPKPPAASSAKDTIAPDFSVELEDAAGRTVRLPISTFGPVRMPIESYIYRRKGRDKSQFPTLSEAVLHTYVAPLRDFRRSNPDFDAATLRVIRLVFDRKPVGAILLDDIGVTRLDPPR
ncbi:MAG: hypothetical protein RLZZ621_1004, partial [Gemmatimonadota bacterium]